MALELDCVSVVAGGATILREASLVMRPGRLVALLGPNGAGKSTALGALAGDVRPARGEARLDGTPLRRIPPRKLALRRAVLTQSQSLDFPMTAFEVAALGRLPCAAHPAADAAIVGECLAAAGAAHLAGRLYPSLSGGERQRVQIARALAQIWDRRGEGAYLLLDEPTAGLDLKHQVATLEICRALADGGAGVLCVLHDLRLAAEFADEAALLKDGALFAAGPPSEVVTSETVAAAFGLERARAAAALGAAPAV